VNQSQPAAGFHGSLLVSKLVDYFVFPHTDTVAQETLREDSGGGVKI
jgi:hypothetical protein